LRFPIAAGEDDEAIKGAIKREAAKLAAELKSGAMISEDAAGRWLRDHSLTKLTGAFSEESLDQLRNALADAWAAGGSFNQLVGAIHSVVDVSDERAAMIAQTVGNTAYIFGRDAMSRQLGYDEKRWSADGTDACGECEAQIGAGWIPIDQPFPGGVMVPCLHDGCDCGVDYRKTGTRHDSFFSVNEVKINEVKRMIRDGREEEAEPVLLELVAAIEREAQIHGGRLAHWYYERLAIIYRRRRDYASEIAILTRYCQYEGAKHAIPEGIQKRLDRARGLLARANEPKGDSKANRQQKGE
jgi:hypothetical protein